MKQSVQTIHGLRKEPLRYALKSKINSDTRVIGQIPLPSIWVNRNKPSCSAGMQISLKKENK